VAFDPADLPVPEGAWEAFVRAREGEADALRAAPFLALHGRFPRPGCSGASTAGVLAQTAPVPPFFGVEDDERGRW
jgi:hypothetical protein